MLRKITRWIWGQVCAEILRRGAGTEVSRPKSTRLGSHTQPESYLGEQGVTFRQRKPVTFHYRHERLHRATRKEPVGVYVVASSKDQADGEVRLKRPYILRWGSAYGEKSWSNHLSVEFGGKRGAELTRFLLRKRIDGIVTIRRNKTYQIILLNIPLTKDGEVDAKLVRARDARKKRRKYKFESPPVNSDFDVVHSNGEDWYDFDSPKWRAALRELIDLKGEAEVSAMSLEEKAEAVQTWDLYPEGKEERTKKNNRIALRFIQKLFGRPLQQKDLVELTGIVGLGKNFNVNLRLEKERLIVRCGIPNIGTCVRSIFRNPEGELVIYNEILMLEKQAPPGMGTRMLYSQVLKAQELGVDFIECDAAGHYKGYFNGYYTWARLGYDSPLSEIDCFEHYGWEDLIPDLVESGALPSYVPTHADPQAVFMHDLMSTEKGREWWQKSGCAWDAKFDTRPTKDGGPSRSVQVIEAYIREKEKMRKVPVGKWASQPQQQAEEITLDATDELILDYVWDVMLAKNLRYYQGVVG